MNQKETAVFGGGCFWCTEAVFKMLKGVSSVLPGYTGGTPPSGGQNPTYEQVSSGKTGHVEAVEITYDPQLTTYKNLLAVFFGSHDPTTRNQQGNDVGTPARTERGSVRSGGQYRSAIFYTTEEQKKIAEEFIREINDSNKMGKPIVTELSPLETFFVAEEYHHNYFASHPGNPYCEVVINPKLEKVQKEFAHLLNSPGKSI